VVFLSRFLVKLVITYYILLWKHVRDFGKHQWLEVTRKEFFGDYGKPVKYTCAGVQVDRRSQQVLDNAP